MSDKLVRYPVAPGPVRADGFHGGPAPVGEVGALDIQNLFSVLRRNLWLILLLGAVGLGGMYFYLSREPVRYRADALIRIRDAQAEMTGGLMPNGDDARRSGTVVKSDPILSEIMVLTGRQVASAVVDREGFRLFDTDLGAPSPYVSDVAVTMPAGDVAGVSLAFGAASATASLGARTVRAPYGQPIDLDGVRFTVPRRPRVQTLSLLVLPRDVAADWVRTKITAKPTEGTDVITVSSSNFSPSVSVRLVNAAVEEYQLVSAARGRELNRRRREFLEARLRETDDSLVAAETALGRFHTRTGVFAAHEQFQVEQSGVSDADRRRKELVAEQRIRRSLLAELDRSDAPSQSPALQTLLSSPEITANPMVSQLYARLTELETRRDELIAGGKPREHPDVQQLQTMLTAAQRRLLDAIRTQVNSLDTRIAALSDVRDQSAAEASRLMPSEAVEVRLNEQVDGLRAIASQLRTELQRTRLAEAADMGQVEIVDRATGAMPLASRQPLKLVLGLLFGLFLGTAIALIRSHLDTALHRRTDVDQLLRVPGLVVIPRLPKVRQRRHFFGTGRNALPAVHFERGQASQPRPALPDLVTVREGAESAAGAYRALRTRLLFTPRRDAPLRSVVITSAWAEEGKTTTAANLAVALAQQGMRVLLIDCDLRKPRLHTLFGAKNARGLTDVLREQGTLEEMVQPTGVERLSLLSSGPTEAGTVGASELFGGPGMTALLQAAGSRYDIVVLDTPPVLLSSDASILAARADGALLVVRAGKTGRTVAQDALQQLSAVGANVLGAVLNDPDAQTARYQEYSQQYAY